MTAPDRREAPELRVQTGKEPIDLQAWAAAYARAILRVEHPTLKEAA